jgi:hypothetical protein
MFLGWIIIFMLIGIRLNLYNHVSFTAKTYPAGCSEIAASAEQIGSARHNMAFRFYDVSMTIVVTTRIISPDFPILLYNIK